MYLFYFHFLHTKKNPNFIISIWISNTNASGTISPGKLSPAKLSPEMDPTFRSDNIPNEYSSIEYISQNNS